MLRLTMDLTAIFASGKEGRLRILIDIGAEVNLSKKGIVSGDDRTPVQRPRRIAAANQGLMSGGDQSVKCLLIMGGHEIDTGEDRILRVPAEF